LNYKGYRVREAEVEGKEILVRVGL